jgi:hypothetical protein
MSRRKVCRHSPGGGPEVVADVPGSPSGLGFDRDGAQMVVSMEDARLLCVRGGELEEAADLSPVAFGSNDTTVDQGGRAYIVRQGCVFGNDPVDVGLIIRLPDGPIRAART